MKLYLKYKNFNEESLICKMSAILFRPWCGNSMTTICIWFTKFIEYWYIVWWYLQKSQNDTYVFMGLVTLLESSNIVSYTTI